MTVTIDHLGWIKKELSEAIISAPSALVVEARIFVTRPTKKIENSSFVDAEKGEKRVTSHKSSSSSPASSETDVNALALAESLIRVSSGRPDVEHLIDQAVSSSQGPVSVDGEHEVLAPRIVLTQIIPVAGPSSLASAVRTAIGLDTLSPKAILKGRPTVTLHVETFGMVKA